MPETAFEAARKLNSALTKAHPKWSPQAEPFKAKVGSLGQFVSKIAYALGGAPPDYVSVALEDSGASVFVAAGDLMYLANASHDASSVRVFPFELDGLVVREAPNVLRAVDQSGSDALVIDIAFGEETVALPGHSNDSNEDALAAFFPVLLRHFRR